MRLELLKPPSETSLTFFSLPLSLPETTTGECEVPRCRFCHTYELTESQVNEMRRGAKFVRAFFPFLSRRKERLELTTLFSPGK